MNNRIGILIRTENTSYENNMYISAIEKFGGKIIFIKDNEKEENIKKKLANISGILLTGGYCVGKYDFMLIKYALDNNLKILGICQGMQSMALYDTKNHLIGIENNSHNKDEGYVHKVYLKESVFSNILNRREIMVNSHHFQTVNSSKVFDVVGYSDDNLIEVVEISKHKFQIGVQWHPERMIEYDEVSNIILKNFVNL